MTQSRGDYKLVCIMTQSRGDYKLKCIKRHSPEKTINVNFVRIRCTITWYLPMYMYVLHTIQGTWLPMYVVKRSLLFLFPS